MIRQEVMKDRKNCLRIFIENSWYSKKFGSVKKEMKNSTGEATISRIFLPIEGGGVRWG
jgi:hypothetical protein